MIDQKTKKKNRGFTLIETIVAIAVLALGITGPLVLAYNSLNATNLARDQVIATFLAQDAMEYILAKRDVNREGGNWLDGFMDDICDDGNGCAIDTTIGFNNGAIKDNNASNAIRYDATKGYNYSSGSETKFTRRINMEVVESLDGGADSEIRVDVTVEWGGVFGREFTLTTHLFNFKS